MGKPGEIKEEISEKLLAQKVPEDVYWKFKAKAAIRRENAKESLLSAVLLYIEFEEEEDK